MGVYLMRTQYQQPEQLSRPEQLAAVADTLTGELCELVRDLRVTDSPPAVLREIVRVAVIVVPGAECGSALVPAGPGRFEPTAASAELSARVDAMVAERGEGPCIDVLRTQRPILVADLGSDARWGRFSPRARALGVRSMLCFPLLADGVALCAISLLARQVRAFTAESEYAGELLASHGAIAYAAARQIEELLIAVETSEVIGRAVGVLMERYSIGAERGLTVLTDYCHQADCTVQDAAEELLRDAGTGYRC